MQEAKKEDVAWRAQVVSPSSSTHLLHILDLKHLLQWCLPHDARQAFVAHEGLLDLAGHDRFLHVDPMSIRAIPR